MCTSAHSRDMRIDTSDGPGRHKDAALPAYFCAYVWMVIGLPYICLIFLSGCVPGTPEAGHMARGHYPILFN